MDYLAEAFEAECKAQDKYRSLLINKMKSLEAAVPKWTDATTDPPSTSGKYLVLTYDGHVIDAFYSHRLNKWNTTSIVVADKRFTHWMDMPALPEENK